MVLNFVEILKIIFLGIVQGITEWLPVSSTGHMLLVDYFLRVNMTAEFREMFIVVIQFGSILAVVVMFWRKLWPFALQSKEKVKWDVMTMWFKVVVAFLPAGVIGLLFNDWIEENFGTAETIALMLIIYGIAFIVVENWNRTRLPKIDAVADITYTTAFAIGLFQVLALIPGTSRSGATIIGALIIGVSRIAAAEFTFFLAIPTMLGASMLRLVRFGFDFTSDELIAVLLGMVVAFVVSIFVIKFLMGYIKKHDFRVFGWYRIIVGMMVLLLLGFQ